MTITFVNSAIPTANPTTSYTITIPTVQVGDLLILANTNRDADTAPSVTDNDTGGETWTQKSSTAGCGRLFYKRATSATSAKTITASGQTGSCSGVLVVLRGATLGGDPFNQYTHEANASGNETHAGFTPTVDGCWIGLAVHNDANDNAVTNSACTSPGSLTEGNEKLSTGGSDCGCSLRGLVQSTAGATGSFTWSQTDGATVSQAFAVEPAKALVADAGSFSFTGTAATLEVDRKISAESGSFSFTGTAASLEYGYILTAAAGSFTFTGSDVTLTVGGAADPVLSAESGSFAFSGTAASLEVGYEVAADAGSFAVTGTAASLEVGHEVAANAGAFSFTGTAASLEWGHLLAANAGSFSFTGTAASLEVGYEVAAAAGAFSFNGGDASLVHDAPNPVLFAESGSFAFTGTAASLEVGREVAAAAGSFAFTGTAATLEVNRVIIAGLGTFIVTGGDAGLTYSGLKIVLPIIPVPVPDVRSPLPRTGAVAATARGTHQAATARSPIVPAKPR